MRKLIFSILLAFLSANGVPSATEDDIIELEAEGSYRFEAGYPIALAKELAFFIAKRNAVESAGRYFSHNSLMNIYELQKDEIYSLAAREIQAEILEERQETAGTASVYRLRIKAIVKASDFVRAEIKDTKQEETEATESYREEMEQYVSKETDPGMDIAKAYRLLREKKWRIAMIYLNHLEKKYPNWDSIYMAKAIAYYILREPVFMKEALEKACRLGNQMACHDLKNLKKLHKQDFGISISD